VNNANNLLVFGFFVALIEVEAKVNGQVQIVSEG